MEKAKSKNKIQNRGKSFRLVAIIALAAFVILILSNLFIGKKESPKQIVNSKETYEFNKEAELSFQKSDGKYISSLDIELAENDFERAQGLMYRTNMEESQGMLFIFPYEEIQSFYMKNTVIPLDMIFVNSALKIVTIQKNTTPYSLESKVSSAPAQYVIETIGGYTDKYNIEVGDKVIFRKTN